MIRLKIIFKLNRLILQLKPEIDKEALVSREKVTDFKKVDGEIKSLVDILNGGSINLDQDMFFYSHPFFQLHLLIRIVFLSSVLSEADDQSFRVLKRY